MKILVIYNYLTNKRDNNISRGRIHQALLKKMILNNKKIIIAIIGNSLKINYSSKLLQVKKIILIEGEKLIDKNKGSNNNSNNNNSNSNNNSNNRQYLKCANN